MEPLGRDVGKERKDDRERFVEAYKKQAFRTFLSEKVAPIALNTLIVLLVTAGFTWIKGAIHAPDGPTLTLIWNLSKPVAVLAAGLMPLAVYWRLLRMTRREFDAARMEVFQQGRMMVDDRLAEADRRYTLQIAGLAQQMEALKPQASAALPAHSEPEAPKLLPEKL